MRSAVVEKEQSNDGVRAQSELRSGQNKSKEQGERASNPGKIEERSRGGAGKGGGGVRVEGVVAGVE